MATQTDSLDLRTEELSREEGRALFDEQARHRLGITGDEFIRAWEAGELDPEDAQVSYLAVLLPFMNVNDTAAANGES